MSDGLPPLDDAWLNDHSEYQQNWVHGLRNPIGLRLQYRREGERVVTELVGDERHMGFPGVVHGGILSAALDDAIGRAAALRRRWVVTARLTTRFRTAAPVGVPLRVEGWMTRYQRRAVHGEGRVLLPGGAVVADAEGIFLPIDGALRERMLAAWPGFAAYMDQEHPV